jgi:hypothetical protein
MDVRCEYIEKAVVDSRQRVVLQLGGGDRASGYQILTIKKQLEMLNRASEF